MRIEFHTNLGNPQVVEVTRVVVKDRYGNPLAAAVEIEPGTIIASALEEGREHEFQELLRGMRLHNSVVVQPVAMKSLTDIDFGKQ